jgi:Asp-tRNA(Asn)/Glu-tRNA(Gln) amidotransferase A subunit family amidase
MPSADVVLRDELARLGAREAARRIREGRLSPVALLEACLARIDALDGDVKAWVHVDRAGALARAREHETAVRAGRLAGPLHGVPVGIKDIIDVAGMPTTAGARPWAHTRPAGDATCVARLRAAGAIVLGKTATTEFAYRDPAATRNPWNHQHTPGGSSAGSGAAVSARMVPLALGSQTVGSILRPAAYCGIVGLKGTYGLVPVEGVVPLAWSLDHVGAFARTVGDAALALGVIAGLGLEPTPLETPRLALATELLARCEPETAAQIRAAVERLARVGARVSEVKLPASLAELGAAGLTVLEAEAAAYHEPSFRAHAPEYGKEIRAVVGVGLNHTAATYLRANRIRLAFRDDVMPLLGAHDALLAPTTPAPAPAGLGSTGDGSLCAPWSYAGVPAITLPIGLSATGLPQAVQLVAAAGQEARLVGAAEWCERVLVFSAAPVL